MPAAPTGSPENAPIDEGIMRRWEEALAHAPTVQHDLRGTIVPPTLTPDSAGRRALELLARRSGVECVALSEPIGQGGMGVVHAGTQLSLGRRVAIKTLQPQRSTEAAAMKLLREAWILGELEHPNVLPVYDVGLDDDGRPLVVLKHVQGEVWRRLMHDPDAVRARAGRDPMEFNLQILMQVCHAIAFSHSRGIVHRDLKPDNVMIGEFGEVYVLDWGLAVSLVDDESGRLPLASSLGSEIAGTPCYMAPEMVRGGPIDERTDVYLLGAMLYELLARQPPHAADDPRETLESALRSRPPPPPGAPPELVAISLRAMSPEPADRYPSAEALRLAIDDYLAHRGSARLAAQAARRLEELSRELGATPHAPSHRIFVYRLFGECRFGFREALERWPDNEPAAAGLARAVEAMVDYELGQGDARAAASLLADLAAPPAALRARVERALAAEDEERRRVAALERLGRELDRRTGQGSRLAIVGVLGAVSTVAPLAIAERHTHEPESFAQGVLWPAFFLVLLGILAAATRRTMMKTAINRRLLGGIVILLVAQMTMAWGLYLLGLSPTTAVVLQFLLWSCVTGMIALSIDRRLFPLSAGYLAAFVLAARFPEQRYYVMSAANLVMTLNVVFVWGRREREQPEARGR